MPFEIIIYILGFGLDDDLDGEDNYNTDDKLSPLQKLEKYMQSDNVYTRLVSCSKYWCKKIFFTFFLHNFYIYKPLDCKVYCVL